MYSAVKQNNMAVILSVYFLIWDVLSIVLSLGIYNQNLSEVNSHKYFHVEPLRFGMIRYTWWDRILSALALFAILGEPGTDESLQYPIAERRESRCGHDSSRESDTCSKTGVSPFFDGRSYAGLPARYSHSIGSRLYLTSSACVSRQVSTLKPTRSSRSAKSIP